MQEIIVYIIGIIVVSIVGYKLYKFFFSKEKAKNVCGCTQCHCAPNNKKIKIL